MRVSYLAKNSIRDNVKSKKEIQKRNYAIQVFYPDDNGFAWHALQNSSLELHHQ